MKPLLLLPLAFLFCNASAQMGPPSHRLRAIAVDDYKYGIFRKWDSAEYHYIKNGNGLALADWVSQLSRRETPYCDLYMMLNWDTARYFTYNSDTVNSISYYYINHQGNQQKDWARFEYNSLGAPLVKETQHLVYNPNGQLTEKYKDGCKYRWGYKGQTLINPDTTFLYVYDPQNPVWALREYTEHYYKGRGNSTLLESRGWKQNSPVTRTTYEYDNNGLLVKITEYDATQAIISVTETTYDNTIYLKKTETYRRLNKQNMQLEYTRRKLYDYNTDKELAETITQVWNSNLLQWDNMVQELYTYVYHTNRYYPETYEMKRWDNGAWAYVYDTAPAIASKRMRLYYEKKWPTDVETTTTAAPSVNLYPSPARDRIWVDIEWETPRPFSIHLYDMQGRLLANGDEPAAGHHTQTIDLAGLPQGNYFISITTPNNNITKQFSIVK